MSLLYFRDGRWWLSGSFRPVRFWPYTSVVLDRILEVETKSGDALCDLRDNMIKMFNEAGVECRVDNKIVFEVTDDDGRTFYLGWKDGKFSVGTDFRTDEWIMRRAREEGYDGGT